MKGIYLGAYRAYHPNHDLTYQDINGLRDIGGDMLDVDLEGYDYVIATPPCNYWTKANYRRNQSEYALKTRCLLPCILLKLIALGKPFLVENVANEPFMAKWGLFNLPVFVHTVGRHTYWTNVFMDLTSPQDYDDIQNTPSYSRQGGRNVHKVVENFILTIEENNYFKKI